MPDKQGIGQVRKTEQDLHRVLFSLAQLINVGAITPDEELENWIRRSLRLPLRTEATPPVREIPEPFEEDESGDNPLAERSELHSGGTDAKGGHKGPGGYHPHLPVARGLVRRLRSDLPGEGGFTVTWPEGIPVTTGKSVASAEHEREVKEATEMSDDELGLRIVDYANEKQEFLGDQRYLGGWREKSTGRIILDVVDVVDDLEEAKRLGRERDQQAIHDLDSGDTHYLDGEDGREPEE